MKENILLICADELRADALRHLGNPASHTPNLDKLASEGVSFSNAFCQSPVCTPSRCSFLSGLYPHVNGHRTMTHMIQPHESILLNELRDAGYYVWINGRNDFLPSQNNYFYKDYCDSYNISFGTGEPETEFKRGEPGRKYYYSHFRGRILDDDYVDSDRQDTDKLKVFIENMPEDKPSFMFLAFQNPHPPYMAKKAFEDLIDDTRIDIMEKPFNLVGKPAMFERLLESQGLEDWTREDHVRLKRIYLAMAAYLDSLVGEIVEKLKEVGVYDDTAIFFISDHGDFTGDYGIVEKAQNLFFDCLVKVPFLYKPIKGTSFQSGINDSLVELVDMYATALDIAGVPKTHDHFGLSLQKILKGEEKTKTAVFCEGGRRTGERQAIEFGPFGRISIEGEYYPRQYAQSLEDGTHTKAAMVRTKRYKYVRRLEERDEFYDLENDPGEMINRIDDGEYSNIIAEHKELLADWYQKTCDIVPLKIDSRFSIDQIKMFLYEKGMGPLFDTKILPMYRSGVPLDRILKGLAGEPAGEKG